MTKCMNAFFTKIEAFTNECSIEDEKRYEAPDSLVHRDRKRERYFDLTGLSGGTSLRTILGSKAQIKLVIFGMVWYLFQMGFYAFEANALVYITVHKIPPINPSFPGNVSVMPPKLSDYKELYDLGFYATPDLSYRPWALKAGFVDLNVIVAQMLPPPILLLLGRTERFVIYTGTIGIINIMKGIVQIMTILPPARQGEACWPLNFKPEQIEIIQNKPFYSWMLKPWGMAHGCNDMLWSGHTAQTTVGFLYLNRSLREMKVHLAIRVLLIIYLGFYVWTVLACRMHYSIDVFVAALVGVFVYTHDRFRAVLWSAANQALCNDIGELGGYQPAKDGRNENSDIYDSSVPLQTAQ